MATIVSADGDPAATEAAHDRTEPIGGATHSTNERRNDAEEQRGPRGGGVPPAPGAQHRGKRLGSELATR